jgi:hypothetical protein
VAKVASQPPGLLQHLPGTHNVLTLKLRITGLLFVTENLLLLLENIQLGLVCFPLPHAGPRSEETLQLTVCGCARLWRIVCVWHSVVADLNK